MPAQPQQVDEIFDEALRRTAGEERDRYLAEACGNDAALKQRVERLLSAVANAGSFLEKPAQDLSATIGQPTLDQPGTDQPGTEKPGTDQPTVERPGTLIGPYKLLQLVGEGGMGSVWMAEQLEPVRRRVALKVIKPGMDSRQVLARFEAERQALSMMDHPNIAKVLDAGTTDRGRPYFVMELVKGQPITSYCDEHQLNPRERLELLLPVCHAIQHAHHKGIIHRDIKPSNVLVAEYDGRPVAKVIDFGVAKAIHQPLTEKTMFTGLGQIVGTLEYMSPEQARVNQLDIDTRSDVYSLGVLLYELLTGSTPFDKQRLKNAALDELLRIIREEEPPRPSTKLSSSQTLPSIAANRRTEPVRLPNLVRGELDWIVMKALEKDRNRRYETANGLAMDIQRYLNDEQVLACPPSAAYRFQKFVRRNRGAMTVAVASAATLLAVAVGSLIAAGKFRSLAERNAQLFAQSVKAETTAREARQDAEDARDKEQQLRQEAESQTQIAQQQTQRAEDALVDAQQQRQRAEMNEAVAEEREVLARRNLYAAHMNLARDAFDGLDVPRVQDLLERHVPTPGQPDWRSFEWYYLLGQCHRDELTINCRHSLCRPAFSPDGKILALAVHGVGIEFWNVEKAIRVGVVTNEKVEGPVAFSPDGQVLAFFANREIHLWDIAKQEKIRSFGEHRDYVLNLAFTPEGKRIVSTDGGGLDTKAKPGIIRVWDVATGQRLHEMKGHTRFIWNMTMSPDGKTLVTAGDGQARIWDLPTGEEIKRLSIRASRSVAWSRRNDIVVTDSPDKGNYIVIWDASTGSELRRFQTPSGIHAVSLSPDGTTLATSHHDSTARLWDVATGKQVDTFQGHSQWVFHVAYSPDGKRIASVGRNSEVKVWPVVEVESGFKQNQTFGRKPEKSLGKDRMQLSADGKRIATVQDPQTVAILDAKTGQVETQLAVGRSVHALDFSVDGAQLAVAYPLGIQIWNPATSKKVQEKVCESTVWTLDFSPDGRQLAVGTDARRVEIYDVASLTRLQVLPWSYATPLRKIAYSPDGKMLAVTASAEPRELHLWKVESWQLLSSMEYVDRWGTNMTFSYDGRLLAVSEGSNFLPRDGAVTRLIDTATGREVAALTGDDSYHTSVAFASNGGTMVTGTEQGKITVWDLNTHEERATFLWEGHCIESLGLSADGRTLVSGDSQCGLRIWRAASQKHIDQAEYSGLHRRATEYGEDDRWQEAAAIYSLLLERQENLTVLHRRAQCYAELGRWPEAIADLKKVAEAVPAAHPSSYRPWYEMALAHLAGGDTESYRRICAAMRERYRETKEPTIAEFVCWTHALRPQEDLEWGPLVALAALPLSEGEGGATTQKNFGAVLLRAGLYQEAVKELEKAERAAQQQKNRTSMDYAWYLLAMAHAYLGHHDKAQEFFDRATLPASDDAGAVSAGKAARQDWFRRVTLRLLRDEAESVLRKASEKSLPTAPSDDEQAGRTLNVLARAIELRADVPRLWRMKSEANLRLERKAEAAADVARAEKLEFDLPLRRLNRLIAGQDGGDFTDRQPIYYDRALHYFEVRRDYNAAIQDCYAVLQVWPDNQRALQLLFRAHAARGTIDQADKEWKDKVGDLTEFYKGRAEYYRTGGQLDKCVDDLTKLIDLGYGNAATYTERAWARIVLRQFANAIADCNEAIARDPRYFRAYYERAWAHIGLGDFDAAIVDCDKGSEIGPVPWYGYQRRSWAHRLKGNLEEAVRDARLAIEANSSVHYGYEQLAEAELALGHHQQAHQAYEEWFRIQPDQTAVWHTYCDLLVLTGDLTAFRRFCKGVVERHAATQQPEVARAILLCVIVAPDAVEDWEPVIRLSQLAGESAHPQVAAMLARAGQFDQAIKLRSADIDRNGGQPNAWDELWLAMMEHGRGNRDKARQLLSQATQKIDADPALQQDRRITLLRREFTALIQPQESPKQESK